MSQQTINIGTVADDQTGDTVRSAFTKTNANFTDLYTNKQAASSNLTTWSGITPGTGVGTALAINVGSAGSFVANGGALGTPSSGTLTSCTGLPLSGLVASTVTALGVGSLEVGHATDTTIARLSAGDISVEGNLIYRAGGTDVPVTDGGTGSSTASGARTNLGLVIGTDVQAFDADLSAVASSGLAAASSTFTPTVTSGSGTITTLGTVSGNYYIIGKLMWVSIIINITTAGTGAGALIVTNLPGTTPRRMTLIGLEDNATNNFVVGKTTAAATTLSMLQNGGTTIIGDNRRVQISGWMEIN